MPYSLLRPVLPTILLMAVVTFSALTASLAFFISPLDHPRGLNLVFTSMLVPLGPGLTGVGLGRIVFQHAADAACFQLQETCPRHAVPRRDARAGHRLHQLHFGGSPAPREILEALLADQGRLELATSEFEGLLTAARALDTSGGAW